ncbi:MAG: HAD hydrolase family protein [Victivallales bacterium]|nr:HAD hydrolase family protein [Victivallales bacterium]
MHCEVEDIRLLILDVDGVLTDGRIGYSSSLEGEIKFFNVQDGTGISMLRRMGFKIAWLSGRQSNANRQRAKELKIDLLHEGCRNKAEGVTEIAAHFDVSLSQCAYIGDDLIDLPAMALVALPVAVGDAVPEVKKAALWQLERCGGKGAVREFAERLLKAQGNYDKAVQNYVYDNALPQYKGEQ